ncbi:MAG: phosphonoacetaldehyde reductase [Winogradskyella sp.]|uniref:phosphonoacetaldehyde reductase n=1 Tax=Winogradskyella sp. TaxID=1883156 RepID=UPI00385B27E3
MSQKVLEQISSDDLKNLFSEHSTKKIFLVTGKGSYVKSGAQNYIESSLEGYEYVRFSDFEQNPKLEDALRGLELIKASQCDMVLAIGGGSVIDMAKLINIFLANEHIDGLEIVQNSKLITKKGYYFIAIPTTAGTGSEATHFAVVYHNNKKYSVAHPFVLPDVVGLNSEFTFSQSPYLTACSGLDALSQAIESYWSTGANEESKGYAKQAITLLLEHLEPCVLSPSSAHRTAVMQGAYLAGKAINISKTTVAHAMSYAFTTYFSIPHGHAVFLTLPQFLIENYKVSDAKINDIRGNMYVKNTMLELYKILNVNSPLEAFHLLLNLTHTIRIETSFKTLGIGISDLDIILDSVNLERLKNNPIDFSKAELKSILLNCFNQE